MCISRDWDLLSDLSVFGFVDVVVIVAVVQHFCRTFKGFHLHFELVLQLNNCFMT